MKRLNRTNYIKITKKIINHQTSKRSAVRDIGRDIEKELNKKVIHRKGKKTQLLTLQDVLYMDS